MTSGATKIHQHHTKHDYNCSVQYQRTQIEENTQVSYGRKNKKKMNVIQRK